MRGRYVLLGFLAVTAMASFTRLRAQQEAEKPTQIVLRPAGVPAPALKYQLLPERRTLVPGNAAIFYHRAIEMSMGRRAREQRGEKTADGSGKEWKAVVDWVKGPLSSIPRDRAKQLLEADRNSLAEIELGARHRSCDWGFGQREETVYLLIEEIQQMRSLVGLVSLRARMAILDGNIDQAMHWIQVGFAVARHVSEGPLVIQSLIGVSLCQVMCRALEDLIQAPGAPNLFWALSHRPRPLIDFSAGFESERFLLESEIPSLRELDGAPWSVEKGREFSDELQRKLFRLAELADGSEGGSGLRDWNYRLGMAALVLQAYPEAKRALIAQGRPVEQVEAMPTVQVAALYTFQQYEQFRDDFFKWTSLPFYQGYKGMEDSVGGNPNVADRHMLFKLFTMLIPAVRSCGRAQALSERRLDAIQCIEAIRLYAALHGGKLPSRLEDMTEAPVPGDTATGKPFKYTVDGDRAVIWAPAPPGGPDHPLHRINYELKLTR
jgi:hypothetical protein